MKVRYILTLIISFVILLPETANAQFVKIGGGAAVTSGFQFRDQAVFASKSGFMGIWIKSVYKLNESFQIVPSFTYFIPHVTQDRELWTVVSSMMVDVNCHYILNYKAPVELYGLAGLDILLAGKNDRIEGSPSFTASDNEPGLNLGIGTYINLTKKIVINGEARYVLNRGYGQFILNAGMLFNLDWKKKQESEGVLTYRGQ